MNLAIKGHATRGDIVIKTLEMFGGKNSNHCTGSYINRIYFINKNGYIESTDDAKFLLYYSSYSLNEFKIRYPYVINDVVSRKCHPAIKFQISQMKWDDVEECVIYVLNNQLTARVDDLQPYKEETMEERKSINLNELEQQLDEASSKETTESLNKWLDGEPQPKAPILSNRYDYAEGKCGYVIPDGYEFDSIKQGFQTEIILRPIKPQYPKTYAECCYILDIDFIDNDSDMTIKDVRVSSIIRIPGEIYVPEQFDLIHLIGECARNRLRLSRWRGNPNTNPNPVGYLWGLPAPNRREHLHPRIRGRGRPYQSLDLHNRCS